jgi:type IV fimbrial biogenesis protein FimT
MKSRIEQTGVTLIELLMVISIAVILTAIGVPSYRYVTTSNRIAGEINGLLGDIQFARYEALKEGLSVTICPTASSTATTCDGSTTWGNGWIVLSNAADTGGTSAVLRRQLPFSSFNSSDTLTSTAGVTSVIFNREGFATLTGTAMFSLHNPAGLSGFTRCLMVNAAGAVMTTTAGNAAYSVTCS